MVNWITVRHPELNASTVINANSLNGYKRRGWVETNKKEDQPVVSEAFNEDDSTGDKLPSPTPKKTSKKDD